MVVSAWMKNKKRKVIKFQIAAEIRAASAGNIFYFFGYHIICFHMAGFLHKTNIKFAR